MKTLIIIALIFKLMTSIIPHLGGEQDVTADGGTLQQETTFYRNKATLTTDHTLTLPTNRGTYVFTKDPKDSITTSLHQIESFLVGPIFHLPDDTDGSDEMKMLIEKHNVVLLVTLIDTTGEAHYLHYLLEKII
jgi:hypothetical protein